jgi:hypothetical protein
MALNYRAGSGPGSPAGQPGWGGGSDRMQALNEPYHLSSENSFVFKQIERILAYFHSLLRAVKLMEDSYESVESSVASQLILYNGGTCSMMTAAVDNYMGRDSSNPQFRIVMLNYRTEER